MAADKMHPHDLSERDTDRALAESRRPDLLGELIAISRRTFGFFTRHYPHTINYPWAVSHLQALPTGSSLLDIGTGVSPVPLFLAGRGYRIDCVDHSDIIRAFPVENDWNEWGYLDYGPLHSNLKSFNSGIEDFCPSYLYDGIYSIGAIAHMPTPVREATLRNCRRWVKAGGLLVLVVDLIPSTDTLWNRGGSDETPEEHGTYQVVEEQLRSLGFLITESRVERGGYRSPSDILFLVARADRAPSVRLEFNAGAAAC